MNIRFFPKMQQGGWWTKVCSSSRWTLRLPIIPPIRVAPQRILPTTRLFLRRRGAGRVSCQLEGADRIGSELIVMPLKLKAAMARRHAVPPLKDEGQGEVLRRKFKRGSKIGSKAGRRSASSRASLYAMSITSKRDGLPRWRSWN